MRAVLVGNYGVGNIGDDALMEYFLKNFPQVEWWVVSRCQVPAVVVYPRLPFGIRSFFRPWWRTLRAVARADALIFGGGSLFTDTESISACFQWALYALVARLTRTPIVLAFQGVGPFSSHLAQALSSWVFRSAAFISVRDEASLNRVAAMGVSVSPHLTRDPAFLHFSEEKGSGGSSLIIIPRKNSSQAFVDAVEKRLAAPSGDIRVLQMEPGSEEDAQTERIASLIQKPVVVVRPKSVREFLDATTDAGFILTQRYHGAVAAFARDIPFEAVPQKVGDKLDESRTWKPEDKVGFLASVRDGTQKLKDFLASL